MKRLFAWIVLAGVAFSTTACVIEEPGRGHGGGGWCYWHPYRCR